MGYLGEREPKERLRREELKVLLREGKIGIEKKFQSSNWPTDPLVSNLKVAVTEEVEKFVKTTGVVLDPQDLKYQTLFRLTTYSPEQLFAKGDVLDKYLVEKGAYSDWRGILSLDANFIQEFKPKKDIILSSIEEQQKIISNRLSKSELPLNRILSQAHMSAAEGWHIKKAGGQLLLTTGQEGKAITLGIHEVDLHYANAVFNDLHYIHTPRATVAIGMFWEGEDIPFSVAGMAPVDRDYKRDLLLMQGYDSDKSWEVVRLYTRPSAPLNTSSIMLSQSIKYLKRSHPEIQTCLSSFTPSFAGGRSMLGGGFEDPVLAKPLTLTFGDAHIDSIPRYERLTSRRLESNVGPKIDNKLPLLPTLELMRSIRRPSSPSILSPQEMVVMKRPANLESL